MFTGLVEHLGRVTSIKRDEGGCTLTIGNAAPILGDCHIGDSIAVNGACLTVTAFDPSEAKDGGWFEVWLANETLSRTDLGDRKVGHSVNLERAMGAHVRFGGHFVQAHVDTTATIVSRTPDGDSVRVLFELAPPTPSIPSVQQYLIPKGYVAIDGTSLTITQVDDAARTFGVMLIQHTRERTTVGLKQVGEKVNIEVDMIGKYVEKSVIAALGGSDEGNIGIKAMIKRVVDETLKEKGVP
ncbi:RIB5 [Sanghuangporus weigelae]